MSPERWQVVREVFDGALNQPAEEGGAWVEKRCGEDLDLRHAVEKLLHSDDHAGNFLSELLPEPKATENPDEVSVGSYRLLRKLGEGGMGSVYVASKQDRSLDRQVAVKLIRSGMESAQTRRRLRAERRILATLEHPNIARLYDSGTTQGSSTAEGQPYFVMELVEGRPIDAFCDAHRLTLRERIQLFGKVCSAVQYAHQHLVVHRDLKPNNILVTPEGEPKLLDFGIAKLLGADPGSDEAASTMPWSRWLTPDYASPEQILGRQVTTVSDVYSLGVLLCKLLVGVLPRSFESMSPAEIERTLEETLPSRPSTLFDRLAQGVRGTPDSLHGETTKPRSQAEISDARRTRPRRLLQQLEGDLDTIVLKALHPDPGQRYSSAEQLFEDLSRHLRGFPVRARPDHWLYRMRKYLRRHGPAVAAAAVFLILLVVGSAALAVQSKRVAYERDQLLAVVSFVKEVFKVAAEGEELTVRQAVDRSAAILERKLEESPEVRATLMDTTGTIYLNLWAIEPARLQLERAVEIRRHLPARSRPALAESLSSLGLALAFDGDLPTGEEKVREALALYRERYGEQHPALVRPLNNLVNLLCYKSDFPAAEGPSVEALAMARTLLPEDSEELARALGNRALVLTKGGRFAEATALYREALALHRRLVGEEHPAIAEVLNNLALVLKNQERFEEAEALYRQNLALEQRLFGESSSKVSVTLNNLAALLLTSGQPAAAVATYGEARQLALDSLGKSHPGALITSVGLASALIANGEPAAAEDLLGTHLEDWRERLGKSWLFAYAKSVLGESLASQGRYLEAEPLLVESYPKIRSAQGDRSAKTRQAHQRLLDLYRAWDRPRKLAEAQNQAPASP